jgi:dTMP kinase
MAAGRFITFEGGEGAGKSTQARLLAEQLTGRGIDVVLTREPGGSPFAEQVRELILRSDVASHPPIAEALLFYAARADHLEKTIRPALAAGGWVVCDRFSDSTRAYQGAAGGLGPQVIDELEQLVVCPTVPDLTFILDVPAEQGLARADARRSSPGSSKAPPSDPFHARALVFHDRLRRGFLDLAAAAPDRRIVIDATAAPERIAAEIWTRLNARFSVGPA